jgi:hypothetical protein
LAGRKSSTLVFLLDHQKIGCTDVVGAAFEVSEEDRAALLVAVLVVGEIAGLLVVDDEVVSIVRLLPDVEPLRLECTFGLELRKDRVRPKRAPRRSNDRWR